MYKGPLTKQRLLAVVAGAAGFLLLAAIISVGVGSGPFRFSDSITMLFGGEADATARAVLEVRALRVVMGVLAGLALAATGVVLQIILRNPLADPFVVGVSGGAALFGSLTIILVGQGPWVPPAAFAGAAGATFFTLNAARVGNRPPDVSILLVGVVLNAFSAAIITFVKTLVEAQKAQEVLFWLVGFVGYARGSSVLVVAACVFIAMATLIYLSPKLNIMSLGDTAAARLGVNVERTRFWALLATSLATGAVVAETGLIGFVGLIIPHALRLIVGPDPRILLPVSALVGGGILCLVDAATRALFLVFSSEPPVGALCAAFGAPIFVLLLRRHLRGNSR